MRIPQGLVIATLLFFSLTSLSHAVVNVTSSELQEAKDLLWPSSSAIGTLDGFSEFQLQDSSSISEGITAEYEARMSEDPWMDDELPHLKITAYSYSTQDSAHEAFNEILDLPSFDDGSKILINSDDHYIYYRTDSGISVDIFGSIDAEYYAYHLIHVNGNLLYQSSIYRPDEGYALDADKAYAEAIENPSDVYLLLFSSLDTLKLAESLLFPPTTSDFTAKSEITSLDLSELYDIPQHGEIEFDLYIGEPEGSVGTILDSSGIATPNEGDLYLYLSDDGHIFAGIYAPDFDSDCPQQAGWYRIESDDSLNSYEWNKVKFHYGVGGLAVYINDVQTAFCHVSQARSENPLYFGDYPGDSLDESMIGYLNDLEINYSLTDSGLIWDEVLTEQLFLDLLNTDPDLTVFQYLKEEAIFLGSDGYLYPDNELNRAEMVKVLLKAYSYESDDESDSEFWDVPSDAWYLKYLNKASKIGMVEGHDNGQFLPGHQINRAEFFTMLLRVSEADVTYSDYFRDVDEEDWYSQAAAFAYEMGIISDKSFYPSSNVTRREAAQALYTLLQ
ncbi:MAG: hypothetical protein ACI9QC_000771 [Oceanicoccus sp.]|jgi:hypothetical protein